MISFINRSKETEIKKNNLRFVNNRLKNAQIFNRDIFWFIDKFKDIPEVLMYLDPPYPDAEQSYKHKFSLDDFSNLLDKLYSVKFKWVLSFYEKDNINLSKFKQIKDLSFFILTQNAELNQVTVNQIEQNVC